MSVEEELFNHIKRNGGGYLRRQIEFKRVIPVYTKSIKVFNEDNELIAVKTEYRLYKALREIGEEPYLIYDVDGFANPKKLRYSLKLIDDREEIINDLPKKLRKKLELDENEIYTPIPLLKNIDFLRNINWLSLVEDIINPGQVNIDPRLKLIRKATLLRGIKQKINSHSIIVLPGQTGKSEWYDSIGILVDRTSAPSLIGSATMDEIRPGLLDESELPIFIDQIEEQGSYLLFRYLFNYMETGRALIDMAVNPYWIRGESIINVGANPIGDPRNDFENLLRRLSLNPALGRRFGIILYSEDAKRIEKREKDLKKLIDEKLQLFRAVEEYATTELNKIVNDEKVWNWLNGRNKVWIDQALKIIEVLKGEKENLYRFFAEFIVNGNTHVRGGALYATIVENLDKIALKEHSIQDILNRAEEVLSELLEINFQSLRNIVRSYEEKKEDIIIRIFDTLPNYLKEIASAVELFRRYINENNIEIKIPYAIPLKNMDYIPSTGEYFSRILDNAKKSNPMRYNNKLKEYLNFELYKENGEFYVVMYDLQTINTIKPLGSLFKSFRDFGEFGNFEDFSRGDEAEKHADNYIETQKSTKILGEEPSRKTLEKSESYEKSEKIGKNPQEKVPNEILKYYENGFDPYLVRCRICGLYFGRNPIDLEAHLRYHRLMGDIVV